MARRTSDTLAAEKITGHVLTSTEGRMAWHWLPPQRWSFRANAEREALINSGAVRFAALIGRDFHLRVTHRPYPVDHWARATTQAFPNALPAWAPNLRDAQHRVARMTLATKETYLGVEVEGSPARRKAFAEELRKIAGIVAGPGLDGRPVTGEELEYLMHRSVSLGAPAVFTLPPPQAEWEPEDFASFTDRASWSCEPFARSVQVLADINGRQHLRFVVTVTMGRMQPLLIPEQVEPWMQRSDRLPFPVEWSVRGSVPAADRVKREANAALAKIESQTEHFAEHKMPSPLALVRQYAKARQVADEAEGDNPLHKRAHVWVRAAVSGATEDEALERARRLTEAYGPAMTLERPADQYRLGREFIPGEPLANEAHKRRMPVTLLAAGGPAVTAVIGDRAGFPLGQTSGSSQRAVSWNPWAAITERERSGATVVSGSPGAGKSTLAGVVAFWSTLAGVRTVIWDPAGPLLRLCAMPDIAPVSRPVDLMNAEPGSLSPYLVIADPQRDRYPTDEAWGRAMLTTRARRRALCQDTLSSLLPLSVLRMQETGQVLSDATRQVPGVRSANPRAVIAALAADQSTYAEHAHRLAREFADLAEMPQLQLIFPDDDTDLDAATEQDFVLQVLAMRGNVTPEPGKHREEWSIEETIGLPLMNLGAHLTTSLIYGGNPHDPKLLIMDEVSELTQLATGTALIRRTARGSRKEYLRALFMGQNTTDSLTAGIENFLDGAFVGRTEGEEEQHNAVKTLGVPRDSGHEATLGSLSPRERQSTGRTGFREFVWNDGDGGVEKVRIDVPERLRPYLDTTADPSKATAARAAVDLVKA